MSCQQKSNQVEFDCLSNNLILPTMLIRAFRLTDKFSNAFLKIAVWLSSFLLTQVTLLRESSEHAIVNLYTGTKDTVDTVTRGSRNAYGATDNRRRSLMAQRAAIVESDSRGVIQAALVEDPLVQQNRTLSMFTVLLLIALIAVVLWATSQAPTSNNGSSNLGGIIPRNNTPLATARDIPTQAPSVTPVPQPLNWRGTLAFSLRENGQEDVFAFQRGDSAPSRLTNNPADDRDPAWSPDGRTLAFVSNREGNWDLYIMDIISKEIRRITFSPGYEGSPTWSPDGLFLAFEAYDNVTNNLDIYLTSVDGSGECGQTPCQVTRQSGADFEPAWMPQAPDGSGGRLIAYTSIRADTQDIYLLDLDNPSDESALNLTNTPSIDENYPAWSPDGQFVAYSVRTEDGIEGVFYRDINDPSRENGVGRGRMPTWNPIDGSSLFYTAQRGQDQSQIIGANPGTLGGGGDLQTISGTVADLDWMAAEPEFEAVVANYAQLYDEVAALSADGRYLLALLPGVDAPDAYLNARVDDSFNALRQRVEAETGINYLGELEDAFWRKERLPEGGLPRESWHYAGRAIALNRTLVSQGSPTPMVVVRENRELGTYWRVYLRVAETAQNGSLGEPLRQIPWNFDARTSGDDLEAYEAGGRRMTSLPPGYYVDFTQLAADYGWEPVPSERNWRQNYPGILYWQFVRNDGLNYAQAIRELYTEAEAALIGAPPIAATATIPIAPTETDIPARTPTPLPPDQQ